MLYAVNFLLGLENKLLWSKELSWQENIRNSNTNEKKMNLKIKYDPRN